MKGRSIEHIRELFVKYILDAKFALPLKIINPLIYYILPVTIFIIFSIYVIFNIDTWEIGISMGEIGWYILLIILFLKPLSQIFSDVRLVAKSMVLRR